MSCEQPKPRKALHKVRQACECCRSRKIRCDNYNPCQNCQRIRMPCVYQIPKKKGPKKRVLLEDVAQMVQEQCNDYGNHDLQASTLSKLSFQPSPLLSLEIMQKCLESFFTHKYPIMPILDREETYATIHHLNDSPTQYGLIAVLCAIIMLQTELSTTSTKTGAMDQTLQVDSMLAVDVLINETCRARSFCNQIDNPSLTYVQTSFFLFYCLTRLGKENAAWFHLRESITMLQLLRLHEEATYTSMTDFQYAKYCRRTFWLLFNTERAYAIQRHRPLTFRGSISLPIVEDSTEGIILAGFLDAVELFRNFGDGFISLWNSSENSTASPQPLTVTGH